MAGDVEYPTRLKSLRNRLGLTQAALAERLGVSFVSVNRWENGQTRPTRPAWRLFLELERATAPGPSRRLAEARAASRTDAVLPAEAVLTARQLRTLAEWLSAIEEAAAGVELSFRLCVELHGTPTAQELAMIDDVLTTVSEELRLSGG